jgi:hypothetical protein
MKYEELIEKFIADWSSILPEQDLEDIIIKLLSIVEDKEKKTNETRQEQRFERLKAKTAAIYEKKQNQAKSPQK